MSGRSKLKIAVCGWLVYCVVKEMVSPSPWNTHDPEWRYPQIYTGTVPIELQEIRGQVAPGQAQRYDGSQPTYQESR